MGFLDRIKTALNPDDAIRKQQRTTAPDGKEVVTDGPFQIATDAGRLICKNCGVQFDSATVPMAQGFYVGGGKKSEHFAVPCRKCDAYSMFLFSDVSRLASLPGMTRQPFAWVEAAQGIKILHDGPLPIYDKQERMLCRYCGVPFDDAALDFARQFHKSDWATTNQYFIKCSNCKQLCGFMTAKLRRRPV